MRGPTCLLVLLCINRYSALAADLCLEAEHANAITFPFQIIDAPDASGGLALTNPEGAGGRSAFRGDTGRVIYHLNIPAKATYHLWFRVRWNGHCSNSIMLRLGRKGRTVTSKLFRRWHWVAAGTWPLEKGPLDLTLFNREDGVWLDQILLSVKSKKPADGPQPTTAVPGRATGEPAEPALFLASACAGLPPLPPTDFRLSHKGRPTVRLDRVPRCIMRAGRTTPLVIWLRNNALGDAAGKITLSTAAPVLVKPALEQTFHLPPGTPLAKVCFHISPKPDFARRPYPLFIRVQHASGKMMGQKAWLSRPFQWLVTNPLVCPKDSGLDTPCPLEAKAAKGFPGPAEGVTWRLAGPDAVTPFGLLDMRRAIADKTYVMAYAYTRVASAKPAKALLDLRRDDMMRVWLNGKPVFAGTRQAPSAQTRQLVPVDLNAGQNHLLVKLCQCKNYWEFRVRFLTPHKTPAPVAGCEVAHLLTAKGG